MTVIQTFSTFPPSPHNQTAEVSVSIGGNLNVAGATPQAATFRVKISGDISVKGKFVFSIPEPILSELDENAFAVQIYTARLLDENNQEILITDASKDQPKGEIGERISLTIAHKDLSFIAIDKRYTFQIGRWENLSDAIGGIEPDWETVCENARLSSRSFSIGRNGKRPNDNLTFDIIESNKNRLNYFPPRNYILFDSLQIDVETDDIERIYTSSGDYIKTTANAFPNLTFYKVLNFIKERCGFDGVDARLPNFPVLRADFPFDRSYAQSLAGIAGMYQPIFSVEGNVLVVKTKFSELPDDFAPRELTIFDYSQLSLQISESTHIDGIRITSNAVDFIARFEDREIPDSFDNGRYGQTGYVEVFITEKWRDYYNSDDTFLYTEKVSETRETYTDGIQTGETVMTKVLDSQGYLTRQVNQTKSRIPLPSNSFEPSLELLSEDEYLPSYKTNSAKPREKSLAFAITNRRSIIVTDGENPYLGEPFEQEYGEAHKSGNITEDMTFSPGLQISKTYIDTFKESNGQVTSTRDVINHLRGANTDPVADVTPGSTSMRGNGSQTRKFIVWADGVSTNSRTGGEIVDVAVGELPLEFARILGNIILDRRLNGFQDGSVSVPGYHKSLNRGIYFRVFDRDGNSLGRFIAEAVSTSFSNLGSKNQLVMTTVQISEV